MSMNEPIWVDEVKSSTYDLKDLPESIEKEICDYLSIEYAPTEKISLKYIGEFKLWGKPIRCWDFGSNILYATVQPYSDSYYIAATDKSIVQNQRI